MLSDASRARNLFRQPCGWSRQSRQSRMVEVGRKATGGVQESRECSALRGRFERSPSARSELNTCIDLPRAAGGLLELHERGGDSRMDHHTSPNQA